VLKKIILGVICLFTATCSNSYAVEPVTPQNSNPVYGFKLKDQNNNTVDFSELKGKPFILFFWTTWCPYCREAIKSLQVNYEKYQKEGIVVLPVNVGESLSRVSSFIDNRKITFKVVLDQDTLLAKQFDVMGIPTYILIDGSGKLRYRDNEFPHNEYKNIISEKK
jgi:peroxiredoxin